ncbi:MAG: hypothetical protein ACREVW_03650 [Burkholderiales bacterium]
MSSTALQFKHFAHDQVQYVGKAIHSFAVSVNKFVAALWSAAVPSRSVVSSAPTALEEADHVRAMADDLLSSDPCFAQELYAAADRHELAALRSKVV